MASTMTLTYSILASISSFWLWQYEWSIRLYNSYRTVFHKNILNKVRDVLCNGVGSQTCLSFFFFFANAPHSIQANKQPNPPLRPYALILTLGGQIWFKNLNEICADSEDYLILTELRISCCVQINGWLRIMPQPALTHPPSLHSTLSLIDNPSLMNGLHPLQVPCLVIVCFSLTSILAPFRHNGRGAVVLIRGYTNKINLIWNSDMIEFCSCCQPLHSNLSHYLENSTEETHVAAGQQAQGDGSI